MVLRAQINLAQLMTNGPGSSKPVAKAGCNRRNAGVERASCGEGYNRVAAQMELWSNSWPAFFVGIGHTFGTT